MSLLNDPLTIAIEKFDWRKSTLQQCKDKFVELTDLYDFKAKQEIHRFDVQRKTSNKAIYQFITYAAWTGYEIKARIKLARD